MRKIDRKANRSATNEIKDELEKQNSATDEMKQKKEVKKGIS